MIAGSNLGGKLTIGGPELHCSLSRSMPYAQQHYPFENKERFENSFPADFVSEGLDQTRGWFYTLLVLSTHLFGRAPWKNLIVTGLVLAEDGRKMSKSLKNYPDPNEVIDKYGADALRYVDTFLMLRGTDTPTRLFLVNSPIVKAENLRFREQGVKEVLARVLLPWLNSFRFFLGQVALLERDTGITFMYNAQAPLSSNVMDRWVLARCQSLIKLVQEEMAGESPESTCFADADGSLEPIACTRWYHGCCCLSTNSLIGTSV